MDESTLILENLYRDVFNIILSFLSTDLEILYKEILNLSLVSKRIRRMLFTEHYYTILRIFERYFWPKFSLKNGFFGQFDAHSVYANLGHGLKSILLCSASDQKKLCSSRLKDLDYEEINQKLKNLMERFYKTLLDSDQNKLLQELDNQKKILRIFQDNEFVSKYPTVIFCLDTDSLIIIENGIETKLVIEKPKEVVYFRGRYDSNTTYYTPHLDLPFNIRNSKMTFVSGRNTNVRDKSPYYVGEPLVIVGYQNDKCYCFLKNHNLLCGCTEEIEEIKN